MTTAIRFRKYGEEFLRRVAQLRQPAVKGKVRKGEVRTSFAPKDRAARIRQNLRNARAWYLAAARLTLVQREKVGAS